MATVPGSGALSALPEIEALKKKLLQIDHEFTLKERALEERKTQFEEAMKIRKEEFDELKLKELESLRLEKQQFQLIQKQQQHILLWEREKFMKEKESFDECQQRVAEIVRSGEQPITLEVGNDKFKTQKSTLAKWKKSIFPSIVESLPRGDSRVFIDRDAKHFKFILNYMRQGERVMRGPASKMDSYTLEEVLAEVEYYKLHDLARLLKRKMVCLQTRNINFENLVQANYFKKSSTPFKFISMKEVLVKGQNLDNIVFDHVDFQHPISFDTCTMVSARFVCCTFSSVMRFQNVDVHNARFENCTFADMSKQIYFVETDETTITFSPPVTGLMSP